MVAAPQNIFDILDELDAAPDDRIDDELEHYLSTPTEKTSNVIQWWTDRLKIYPNLSQMAIDYLTIPGTYATVDPGLSTAHSP